MHDERQRVVRPHRYALMLELSRPLTGSEFAIHEVRDKHSSKCSWGPGFSCDRYGNRNPASSA
ncbi:hypothetical protein D4768_30380 (plasmid) [Rhodococcus erythropolis]|nr:hypothetical protein D4768_30380 [Rhodococcus erythropolis]